MLKPDIPCGDVLIGIGTGAGFTEISRRFAPAWHAVVFNQAQAPSEVDAIVASARRLVVASLAPGDTDLAMAMADRHPRRIDGVVLQVRPEQVDRARLWYGRTRFAGVCKFNVGSRADLARTIGTILADIDARDSARIAPAGIVQLR